MTSPLSHCNSLAGKDEGGNVTRVTSRKGIAETRAAFQAARILRAGRGIEPRSSEWFWLVLPVASLYMEEKTEAGQNLPLNFLISRHRGALRMQKGERTHSDRVATGHAGNRT